MPMAHRRDLHCKPAELYQDQGYLPIRILLYKVP
jgi:hypothetical protein